MVADVVQAASPRARPVPPDDEGRAGHRRRPRHRRRHRRPAGRGRLPRRRPRLVRRRRPRDPRRPRRGGRPARRHGASRRRRRTRPSRPRRGRRPGRASTGGASTSPSPRPPSSAADDRCGRHPTATSTWSGTSIAKGVWNTAAATVPAMLAGPDPSGCRFVAVASAAGTHGLFHLAAYNAAKHAVVGIVQGPRRRPRRHRRHRLRCLTRLHRHRHAARRPPSSTAPRPIELVAAPADPPRHRPLLRSPLPSRSVPRPPVASSTAACCTPTVASRVRPQRPRPGAPPQDGRCPTASGHPRPEGPASRGRSPPGRRFPPHRPAPVRDRRRAPHPRPGDRHRPGIGHAGRQARRDQPRPPRPRTPPTGRARRDASSWCRCATGPNSSTVASAPCARCQWSWSTMRRADPDAVAAVARRHGATLLALEVNVGPAGCPQRGPGPGADARSSPSSTPTCRRPPTHCSGWPATSPTPRSALVGPRVSATPARAHPRWFERYDAAASSLDPRDRLPAPVRPGAAVAWLPSACLVARTALARRRLRPETARRRGRRPRLAPGRRRAPACATTPTITVLHDVRPTARGWLGRKFVYGSGSAGLAARHGSHVAPAVLSPAMALAGAALLMRRRWSLPAAACALGMSARSVERALPRTLAARPRVRLAGRLAARGTGWSVRQQSALLLRHWWPAAALGCAVSASVRRAVGTALVVDGCVALAERTRPGPSAPVLLVGRRLDDLAYGTGLWWGAMRSRSLAALRPRRPGRPHRPPTRARRAPEPRE